MTCITCTQSPVSSYGDNMTTMILLLMMMMMNVQMIITNNLFWSSLQKTQQGRGDKGGSFSDIFDCFDKSEHNNLIQDKPGLNKVRN